MLDDHTRLAQAVQQPALVRLHRALSRLCSVVTVMNTGAHPDDEANGLLAALRYGYGMRVVVACSTRGEGGQNALGPERGGLLGALRTAEMEEAARRLDADVAWLGHGPDDPVHDFGFSKNGDDTLARWGEERIVERLVLAYRQYRPDIVIPTFLDVPGQHGHHRAMTRAAERAFALAADPDAFPQHRERGLLPWQASKFYLPAWSGAGYAYDDEAPPPPATLVVEAAGGDAVTGMAYRRLGEWSRAAHASQGMGVWRDHEEDSWKLHLKLRTGGPAATEADIRDSLPADLTQLGASVGIGSDVAGLLREAQERCERAIAAFPDRNRITVELGQAARALEAARSALDERTAEALDHRLARKLREIDAALFAATTGPSQVSLDGPCHPGAQLTLTVRIEGADTGMFSIAPRLPAGVAATEIEHGPGEARYLVQIPESAPHTQNFPAFYDPLGGNSDAGVTVSGLIEGRSIRVDLDPDEPWHVVPARPVSLEPSVAILRIGESPAGVEVQVAGAEPTQWQGPAGWEVRRSDGHWVVEPPSPLGAGLSRFTPVVDGRPASQVQNVAFPHTHPVSFVTPADMRVLALDVGLPPGARIGYVAGGSDHVGEHMRRLGLEVTDLTDADLAQRDLSGLTTIVVGIFAYGRRQGLRSANDRLHRFTEQGGHLVTLYHRPTDGWDPDRTPPRRLAIGSPSLRWRVTNPEAPVAVLAPQSPLLTRPNRIGPDDWSGWDKERGLYFAADYDGAYEELLSISDAGEAPLKGALVSASVGKGRHTHVALVLHHQLDKLVPGAFRLLANLVHPAW